VVATTQERWDHDRPKSCLTTAVQPDCSVLQHCSAGSISVVVGAAKHSPTVEVNVYVNIALCGLVSFAGKIH
jgi:hypothetical protein